MDILTKEELKNLINDTDEICVSFYLPTDQKGKETTQGPIRLKNLAKEAEQQLLEHGMRTPEVRKMLEPVEALMEDFQFWQNQSNGLALFLSSAGLRSYRLPLIFEPVATVSDRFHIKPLFPLLTADGHLFVLAISQGEVRLLRCTRFEEGKLDLPAGATSLSEALKFDDPEQRLQYHTSTSSPAQRGERPAHFHGHGVGTDDDRSNILRYFHKVDADVRQLLGDENAPLILAGVDYLMPIYQEANQYPHLLDETIQGNPEELRDEELQQQAWEIARPLFEQAQKEAAMTYERLANSESDQASAALDEILPAVYAGRVETLFVPVGKQKWGQFDLQAGEVQMQEKPGPGVDDLLDLAAAQIFSHGGTVYAVRPEDVPGQADVAAVFRY